MPPWEGAESATLETSFSTVLTREGGIRRQLSPPFGLKTLFFVIRTPSTRHNPHCFNSLEPFSPCPTVLSSSARIILNILTL